MTVICFRCGALLATSPASAGISHGLCRNCVESWFADNLPHLSPPPFLSDADDLSGSAGGESDLRAKAAAPAS